MQILPIISYVVMKYLVVRTNQLISYSKPTHWYWQLVSLILTIQLISLMFNRCFLLKDDIQNNYCSFAVCIWLLCMAAKLSLSFIWGYLLPIMKFISIFQYYKFVYGLAKVNSANYTDLNLFFPIELDKYFRNENWRAKVIIIIIVEVSGLVISISMFCRKWTKDEAERFACLNCIWGMKQTNPLM